MGQLAGGPRGCRQGTSFGGGGSPCVATASWSEISLALSSIHIPDIFILVLDLAIKYISLLGGLVLDMLYALKLRSVGRNRDKTASLSGVAGTVFLKSKEAADRDVCRHGMPGLLGYL